jgi:oligopeptide transport system ATP-binding protein
MTMETGNVLLSVRDLACTFSSGRGWRGRGDGRVHALRGVSFDLREGECLAVVGESGSGKTTLARSLLRLIEPTGGQVLFRGRDVLGMTAEEIRSFRKRAQIVFQDPFGSLNPRHRAGNMIREVLVVHASGVQEGSRADRVQDLLALVGLHAGHAHRFPHQLSGGQRQRLALARSLSVGPELLILDEPVSSLDLSIQAQILTLLRELQDELGLTLILIAHDLAVVRQVADRVAVLYGGRIMETAQVSDLFDNPLHPYTRGLMEAADPLGSMEVGSASWAPLSGEVPDPMDPSAGCPYHLRCPHPARDEECRIRSPLPAHVSAGRIVACWKSTGEKNRG